MTHPYDMAVEAIELDEAVTAVDPVALATVPSRLFRDAGFLSLGNLTYTKPSYRPRSTRWYLVRPVLSGGVRMWSVTFGTPTAIQQHTAEYTLYGTLMTALKGCQ